MEDQTKLRRNILITIIILIVLVIVWKVIPFGGGEEGNESSTPVSDIQLTSTTVGGSDDDPAESSTDGSVDSAATAPSSTEIPLETSALTQIPLSPTARPLLVSERQMLAGSSVTYSNLLGYRVDISKTHVIQYLNNYSVAFFLEVEKLSVSADEDPLDRAIRDALIHNYVTYKPEEAYDFELDGHVGKRFDFYARDPVGDYIYKGSVIAFPINDQQAFVISGYGFMRFGNDIWEDIGLPAFEALLSGIDIAPSVP